MLRKIVNLLVILPLAIVFIVFALANRHLVMLSFDPFDPSDAALGLRLPLFVIVIAFAMVGVVVGGIATWFGQRHWRRAARANERDAHEARTQLADLRGRTLGHGEYSEAQFSPPGSGSAQAAPQSYFYKAIGRDKPGAAL
ncbi:MAG: DUF1049 domain-containing protein [Rhizobiales bacterium]|nr:DUF1049 domain-containing protein [Hyphomicrobiales bacterium]